MGRVVAGKAMHRDSALKKRYARFLNNYADYLFIGKDGLFFSVSIFKKQRSRVLAVEVDNLFDPVVMEM
jgi:hypothetical protein